MDSKREVRDYLTVPALADPQARTDLHNHHQKHVNEILGSLVQHILKCREEIDRVGSKVDFMFPWLILILSLQIGAVILFMQVAANR